MSGSSTARHVSILALPGSASTSINGLYETLVLLRLLVGKQEAAATPFLNVDIVGRERGIVRGACGLPVEVHRSFDETRETDLVVIPLMLIQADHWAAGSNPDAVAWLREMHTHGAGLYSACAGAMLLAETGLIDGLDATTQLVFAPLFRRHFPRVRLRAEQTLITAGAKGELVTSGGASSWQDLALYVIARHASPTAAQRIGQFLPYRWHTDAQAPFISVAARTDHGDSVVCNLQEWAREHYAVPSPVEEMVRRSGLPRSSFRRRFRRATGYSPLEYVHHLRVEEARRRLEQSDDPVDEICWSVGYSEPPFFSRLFRRMTRLTPGDYRRRFQRAASARGRPHKRRREPRRPAQTRF